MPQLEERAPASTEVRTARDLAVEGARWWVDRWISFYDYVRIEGSISHPSKRLAGVYVIYDYELREPGRIGLPSPDQPSDHACRFLVSTVWAGEFDPVRAALAFQVLDGSLSVLRWTEIRAASDHASKARANGGSPNRAQNVFFEGLRKSGARSVLEIGSRARSGITRRDLFTGLDYVGIDILPGENVDLVGDAHEVSRLVGGRTFDAVFSIFTFEHLLMPWKVAVEINRVLNPGGLLYVRTHQSVGMHDLPWDYWRYSDTAWHGLFNRHTGFEILATHLGEPMHLVPFDYAPRWKGNERAAGFDVSAVACRKIANTCLSWDVPLRAVAVGDYPDESIPTSTRLDRLPCTAAEPGR